MKSVSTSRAREQRPPIRARAFVIAILLTPPNLLWVMQAETINRPVFSTLFTLFFNVTFTLFILVILNAAVKRASPRAALAPAELLIIYVMLSIATGIFGHDLMVVMVQALTGPTFQTPENEWATLFFRHIPSWITVVDSQALNAYQAGESTLYVWRHLRAWLPAVIVWSSFLVVLLFVLACINAILRKQWTENEKLAYPIIRLPFELAHGVGRLGVPLWVGFALAGAFDLLNGLHGLVPAVPAIQPSIDVGPLFTDRPWNGIGWTPVAIYPFVVGLAYFLPLNLAFSAWFFHLFWKAELVFRSSVGIWQTPGPLRSYPTAGAWIMTTVIALWMARRHLLHVVHDALHVRSRPMDSDEPMSYRAAVLGVLLGTGALVLFLAFVGMSPSIALLFLGIYIAYAVAIARIRAQIGPPALDATSIGPEQLILNSLGSRGVGQRSIALFSSVRWMSRSYRSHPVGHQLEGFRLAQMVQAPSRRFLLAMTLASIIGVLCGFWVFLDQMYRYGASHVYHQLGREPFLVLEGWLRVQGEPDYGLLSEVALGSGITLLLAAMHQRFVGFPFHPIGYVVACCWEMSHVWFSIFLAWAIKWSILKYGGIALYRRMVPFFLGVILGQHVIGGAWAIFGEIRGAHVYQFFPYAF